MIRRSSFVATVASASLLLAAMDTAAAPSTMFLEGTTVSYSDYFAGTDVPGNVGQQFSIKVTFDVANGTQSSSSLPGSSFSQSIAVRGCRTIVNGLCAEDFGTQMPVVTDYSVAAAFAPAGGLRPIPTADYLWDLTSRFNRRATGIDPWTLTPSSAIRSNAPLSLPISKPDMRKGTASRRSSGCI